MTLPKVVHEDSQLVTSELIAAYEAMTGKTLYPAQVERLLIDLIAYRETLMRASINDAARQNLVRFSRAPMLDYLGDLVGVTRLQPQAARTTLRFYSEAPVASGVVIPKGFRVKSVTGAVFATQSDALIPSGQSSVEVLALCDEPGAGANGFLPGDIKQSFDLLPDGIQVVNVTFSSGGADMEGDDRLRERIILAPEHFSVAGPALSYRYHAMSANQSVVDVAVLSPEPGQVVLYPLVQGGLPSEDVLAQVAEAASADDVRPLCDTVTAASPVLYEYAISAEITLYHSADAADTLARATAAAQAWADKAAAALGSDIVRSQIMAALSVSGVYRVHLALPLEDVDVPENGWASCTGVSVSVAGGVNG
jgi:phage-related baseplate assembly protein